jgi:hypothetical protein
METEGPHVRTGPVRCAPSQAPCPTCGKLGRRKATHRRRVRTLAYKRVVYLDVTSGDDQQGPLLVRRWQFQGRLEGRGVLGHGPIHPSTARIPSRSPRSISSE